MFYAPLGLRLLAFAAMIGLPMTGMGVALASPKARSKDDGPRRRARSSKRRTWSKKKHIIKMRRKKITKKSKQINRRKAA